MPISLKPKWSRHQTVENVLALLPYIPPITALILYIYMSAIRCPPGGSFGSCLSQLRRVTGESEASGPESMDCNQPTSPLSAGVPTRTSQALGTGLSISPTVRADSDSILTVRKSGQNFQASSTALFSYTLVQSQRTLPSQLAGILSRDFKKAKAPGSLERSDACFTRIAHCLLPLYRQL